jgi:hypothetical protein
MTNYYSVDNLENIARSVVLQYDPYFLKCNVQSVPIEQIVEDYGLDIDYMRLTYNRDFLGQMIFADSSVAYFDPDDDKYKTVDVTAGTMIIESTLLDRPQSYGRYRFTLAHELAHWILHKKIFTDTTAVAAYHKSDEREKNAIEWQANYLAAAILMPAALVKRAFNNARGEKGDIVKKLAKTFEVSKQAMQIRIKELGLA